MSPAGQRVRPAVVSFYEDHDRSVRDTALWHLDWLADAEWVDGAAGDRATVAVGLDDERLRLTVTDDLAVTAVERAETD